MRGFFASIVARIGVPEISEHLMEVIDAELGAVAGIGPTRTSRERRPRARHRRRRLRAGLPRRRAARRGRGRRRHQRHARGHRPHRDGDIHAVDDTCSHANVSLSEGELDGCTLECWLHGSRFDIRTGEPSGPPAIVPIDVYPVKVEDDDVFVGTTPLNA